MEDPDPYPGLLLGIFNSLTLESIIGLMIMLVLLLCSALISGSEVAFFSLAPQQLKELKESKSRTSDMVLNLLRKPKRLLATILIGNNFVNVGIIILSTFLVNTLFDLQQLESWLVFVIQLVAVTFIILLFGEVIPKVYATRRSLGLARFMSYPILALAKIFQPLSTLLISSTNFIDKRIKRRGASISVDELSHALELTKDEDTTEEEEKLLKGIVKFGETDVKQIMKPRTDVVALKLGTKYDELLSLIIDSGYSRIPVFKESFDQIEGILYIKDLLPNLDKEKDFKWSTLIRKPFFVPENKKIDDLLKEFQEKKIHLAVVVDEYGGTSGIVTLEDIIEEIVGDITDEFDDDDLQYSKLDESNYVFDGKTPLIDLYRVLNIEGDLFEEAKGESDTIAGFVVEITGKIPLKNERIDFENYQFTVEAADKRRVKTVKVTILEITGEQDQGKVKGQRKKGNGRSVASLFICVMMLLIIACEGDYIPKPKGYFRIDLPKKAYQSYQKVCPFNFEYSIYAKVDSVGRFCNMDINYTGFHCKIHLTYFAVEDSIRMYLEEARELAMKHMIKASAIEEKTIMHPDRNVYGLVYQLEGNAASSCQFYLTDSTDHFLRGAMYFSVVPNADSLAPVNEYIIADIYHLINTFSWSNSSAIEE